GGGAGAWAGAAVGGADPGGGARPPPRDMGEDTVQLGGLPVPVTRWAWSPVGGALVVAWTQDGLPVQYSVLFFGQRLTATARELPTSDWGDMQISTFQATGGGAVMEEEL
ncbi:MAG: hypothetical protein VX000_04270, partial [Myxococcota bacterium]|nr:hypothetical protein [Myxococcota bacterium]